MIILTLLVVSVGGLVEIVPLFFQRSTTTPVTGLKPYDPVRLTGRDVYVREGCYLCHSQMIRPFAPRPSATATIRWQASTSMTTVPMGSKRTGPDLARVGGRYSTNGTACICSTRAMWCPNRTCRLLLARSPRQVG